MLSSNVCSTSVLSLEAERTLSGVLLVGHPGLSSRAYYNSSKLTQIYGLFHCSSGHTNPRSQRDVQVCLREGMEESLIS